MAGSEIYCSLLLIGVVTVVCGNEDMRDAINQVGQLQADLLGKIVPSYIQNQVEQTLTRILGDQPLYDRVRHLKHSQQQMKRHIHSIERRLKTLEDDRDEKMKTIVRLQEEQQQCEVRMTDLQREVNSSQLHVSNVYSELKQEAKSTQLKLDYIEDNYSKIMNNLMLRKVVDNKMDNISSYCTCVDETMSSIDASLTYPPTPVTTVTSRVVEEMNSILVIQRLSSTVQYPHQIDLHNNEMSTYTNLRTSHIVASTYDPISRRVIFSRYTPAGIYSSRLNVVGVETLRLNVKTYGIVVDADRRIVFLTTYHPGNAISRMTTTGKHFRVVVDLTDYSSYAPRGIAVDGRQKVIYFCAWNQLSSVDYNGKNLRRLQTSGNGINTVVFDEGKNSLFFNVYKKVMMKSLATNRNTKIKELSYDIWKFVLYNNSLYISSWNAGNIDVINLENNVRFNLRKVKHRANDIILIH